MTSMAMRLPRVRNWLAGAALLAIQATTFGASPELTVSVGGRAQKFTQESLLADPAAVSVTVPQDVAYKRAMTYRAVPMSALLAGAQRDDSVRFVAADGFVATMQAGPLLATADDAPRAYLAVEPPNAVWPALKAGGPSAGPFYLVWLRPERGRISPEQWPYQIARIEDVPPVAARFPMLAPAASVSANDPIRHGFAVFQGNCLPCHTLNLGGDARVGPDLNVPFSPTEYMREDFLRMQVRNPQAIRVWPDAKMPAFGLDVISERDLDDLLAYLYYMAKRKVDVPGKG
jgi:mono/diheme cytochrome c family protein